MFETSLFLIDRNETATKKTLPHLDPYWAMVGGPLWASLKVSDRWRQILKSVRAQTLFEIKHFCFIDKSRND